MALQHAALPDWVCLEAHGPDATAFLHSQLSRAVLELDASHAPLAAWADARGRVRAVLRVCRATQPERWLLVTPRDGANELLSKLRLFVLRSKVTLALAADVGVTALLGAGDEWLAAHDVPAATPTNRLVRRGDLALIRVGPAYWQAVGAASARAAFTAGFEETSAAAAALAEIELGIPAITAALTERYVAQMLNLDELDAVSFDKGCYPGQEIIARVHNLGGVKRRARRYAAQSEPPAVGTPVLAAATQVGEVVRSAPGRSGCELLAVVEHSAAGSPLTCAGAPLAELPLPFAVPRD
jgi:folate-binding protein YgfZ